MNASLTYANCNCSCPSECMSNICHKLRSSRIALGSDLNDRREEITWIAFVQLFSSMRNGGWDERFAKIISCRFSSMLLEKQSCSVLDRLFGILMQKGKVEAKVILVTYEVSERNVEWEMSHATKTRRTRPGLSEGTCKSADIERESSPTLPDESANETAGKKQISVSNVSDWKRVNWSLWKFDLLVQNKFSALIS